MYQNNFLGTEHGNVKLEFKLKSINSNNNIFDLKIINNKGNRLPFRMLIDTGASIPVWVDGSDSFNAYFPDNRNTDMNTVIRGFGNGFEVAPINLIPYFELSDGNNKIIYSNLLVAVMKRDYSFNMIWSFTMINKFNYSYNCFNEKNERIHPVF